MFKYKGFIYISVIILLSCSNKTKTDFDIVKNLVEKQVLIDAKTYLNEKPITVTALVSYRSAGTKHDFYSEGYYWWPNLKYQKGRF